MEVRVKVSRTYKALFVLETGLTMRDFDEHKIYDDTTLTPELLDISLLRKCDNRCSYCYTNSEPASNKMLTIDKLQWLYEKFMSPMDRPFQVAYGGGEPGIHPQLIDILEYTRSLKIVPNYTTNGTALLNDKIREASSKYCGGVALTYHREYPAKFKASVQLLKELKCQKNIHFLVSRDSVDQLEDFIDTYADYCDAIVLLEMHPIGRASTRNDIGLTYDQYQYLKTLFKKYKSKLAVGASFVPLLIESAIENGHLLEEIGSVYWNPESLLSGYITEDLELAPSSFWQGPKIKLTDFKSFTEAYNSDLMRSIRRKQKELQKKCPVAFICNGGMHADCHKHCKFIRNETYSLS